MKLSGHSLANTSGRTGRVDARLSRVKGHAGFSTIARPGAARAAAAPGASPAVLRHCERPRRRVSAQHASLRDNARDELRRRDVERWVPDTNPRSGHLRSFEVGDLLGRALLDDDASARGSGRVQGGARGRNVEGDAWRAG